MIYFIILINSYCSVFFYRSGKVDPVEFQYDKIAEAHYGPHNEKPFPLTVRRGNNLYPSLTKDARYLFFASDSNGNFDVYIRDLKKSVVAAVTNHPAPQYKPAVSPDGKKLAFVTERYDSEGDIGLAEINPEKIIEKSIQGEYDPSQFEFALVTNEKLESEGTVLRAADTDPSWSNDSRFIVFATSRFSPGITNIAVIDTANKNKITQITKDGGASPVFSPDGKSIFYVSYKANNTGDIFHLDLSTDTEKRITNDPYQNLSPAPSEDGKYLYYVSIRKDTDKNGKVGLRDDSYIIRNELATGTAVELTAGNLSLFDLRTSGFNGGSIVFTASVDNALNIFFIPKDGEIPRQKNIDDQYEISKLYRERSSAFAKLAFDSLYLFYKDDPLYPIYKSRADWQMIKEYTSEGYMEEADRLVQDMLKTKYDPNYGFSYALAKSYLDRKKNLNTSQEILNYCEEMRHQKNLHPEMIPSLYYWAAEVHMMFNENDKAIDLFKRVLSEYPGFYRKTEMKRMIGELEFRKLKDHIPAYYQEVFGTDVSNELHDKKIADDVLSFFENIGGYKRRIRIAEEYLNGGINNKEILFLLKYVQAYSLFKLDRFEESLQKLDEYLSDTRKGSYVGLLSRLLKFENAKNLGNTDLSNQELNEFILNYSRKAGVKVSSADIKDSFFYFETKARSADFSQKTDEAIRFYSFNNKLLMNASISRFPMESFADRFSPFYHKKMTDTVINAARKEQQEKEKSLLTKLNLLGKERLDAYGRSTSLAAYFFRWSPFRVFGDFRDIRPAAFFSTDRLRSAEKFYEENLKTARENLDAGTVYGFSYFLIMQSVMNESHYLNENSLTYARKKEILKNLKQAEYELRWLIYADPDYTEAYLLLGWLYQYIEVRKNTVVFPENEEDSRVYESLYARYFPLKKYLEEAVELYTQIEEFLGERASRKVKSDLHLNMGNCQFQLKNQKNALGHYEEVEKLSRHIQERTRFENYQQNAVFYFNFARAKIFNAELESARESFQKSMQLYYKYEYYPLVSKIGTDQNAQKENIESLNEVKKKLALLHTLTGITEIELEKYDEAILSLSTAVSMNGDSDYINDMNLYNALAICYQQTGDYERSEIALRLSDREFQKKKRITEIIDFSFWDLVIPDQTRIQGEGRFPEGMPLAFTNLITRGIRIQNLADKKEFFMAAEKIQERSEFILDNKLDRVSIADRILKGTVSELAYNEYQRGNYFQAADFYLKDKELKISSGKDYEAYKAFIRERISIFSFVEENTEKISLLEERLRSGISQLNVFHEKEIRECLPVFSGNDSDRLKCEKDFRKNFPEFDIYLGYTYFYLGEIISRTDNKEAAYSWYGNALLLLKNPAGIPDEEFGLDTDFISPRERTRLRIAVSVICLRLGEKQKFEKEIREAYYTASEYQFEREMLSIYLIQAEYYYLEGKSARTLELVLNAETLLKNSPGLFYSANELFLFFLFALEVNGNMNLGNMDKLRISREKLYSAIFFRQLLVNELKFQDYSLFDTLNDVQFYALEDREYSRKYESAVLKKMSTKDIIAGKQKNLQKFNEKFDEFLSLLPEGMDVSSWNRTPPKLELPNKKDEMIIELYTNGKDYVQNAYYMGKRITEKYTVKDRYNLEDISAGLNKILVSRPEVKSIVIIPAPILFRINFSKLPYEGTELGKKYKIRHLFRMSELVRESQSEFSRLKRITSINTQKKEEDKKWVGKIIDSSIGRLVRPVEISKDKSKEFNLRIVEFDNIRNYLMDSDIVEGAVDFLNRKHYLGEKKFGHINMKEIAENQWSISTVIVNNYKRTIDNYVQIAFLFDILQFAGVQSIVLLEEDREDLVQTRNELISNLSSAGKIIQEKGLTIVGEQINPYQHSEKEFEAEYGRLMKLSAGEERNKRYLNAIRYQLQANSVLTENRPELVIRSELNIARLKTYLFVSRNYLQHYETLLSKYSAGTSEEEKILYEMLIRCYESSLEVKCENYFERHQVHPGSTDDRKFITRYYRALRRGDLTVVDPEYRRFISIPFTEDRYSTHLKLAYLFSRGFIWDKAVFHAREAGKLADTETEKKYSELILSDIEYEIFFIKGIDPNIQTKEKIYYFATSRSWAKYREKINNMLQYENNYFKKNYQTRIYEAFEHLETNSDFEPVSLGPLFLKDGRTSLYLLKEPDRNFLFHLLLKSIQTQLGNELNNQFDFLIETEESLNNRNRSLWMKLQWASALYRRGDMDGAKKYFSLFERNFEEYYPEKSITMSYFFLRFKLSKIFKDISFSEKERKFVQENFPDWFRYYEEADQESESRNYLNLVKKIIREKAKEKLDIYNSNEMNDFFYYLMKEAHDRSDWVSFLELSYWKEKFKAFNDKIGGKFFTFGEIPAVRMNTVQTLLDRLPADQSFKAMADLGIKTILLSSSGKKFEAKEVFNDNRRIKFRILDYIFTVKNGGTSIVKQESLENRYRTALGLEKNKLTYLYMPSYHFKALLEPEELDHYYYVLDLESLAEKKMYSAVNDTQKSFNVKTLPTSVQETKAKRILHQLENLEIKSVTDRESAFPFIVSQENLKLYEGRQILFDGRPLNSLSAYSPRNYPWMLTGSDLADTSLHNDDFVNSLAYLGRLFNGPGIVSFSNQADTHTAFFLKSLLKKNPSKVSLFERYTDAFKETQLNMEEDRFWLGWKPYTNVLISSQ
ncbi:MAG TPA: hypothetical protein PL163_01645 [Leptospiraceae bacterium]|nr:hypothetical protein [Leptospiraceae bacterium]HMY65323.1 hypothetical protein [Leptospiraceae bacterium]